MALKVLRKNWQFRQAYRQGKKIVCKHAIVFFLDRHEENEAARVGVVASKRVGGAVQRNRAKRLLREVFRQISKDTKHQDFWIVAVARSTILNATYQETLMDIRSKLDAEGVLDNDG
jgi:ribonuclease P protein component